MAFTTDHEISIIYCYRNRDVARVRRSLASLMPQLTDDIEVIFVDYGSEPNISDQIRELLDLFPKVKYVYNETRGWPWSRAHALNTGVQIAQSKFVFTADIDLVFSSSFLHTLSAEKSESKACFFPIYLLPENFSDWESIENNSSFDRTSNQGLGISLIPRKFFQIAGGYNEFFTIWGYEDNELQQRFARNNLFSEFRDIPIAFHQWHPVTFENRSDAPFGWRGFVHTVFQMTANQTATLDFRAQGRLYKSVDRKALAILNNPNTHFVPIANDAFYIQYVLQSTLNRLSKGETKAFLLAETTYREFETARTTRWVQTLNSLVKKLALPFQLRSNHEHRHLSYFQLRDLIIFFVINNRDIVSDFAWDFSPSSRTIRLVILK
jgi:glycosyltransferase involved in cell wall biosynthesis